MKVDDVYISASVVGVMEEARRRFESFAVRENKPLDKAWLGLGMPSEYRAAVDAGYMGSLDGKTRPRTLTWYLLTEAGVDLYRKMFPGSEEGTRRKYRDGQLVELYAVEADTDATPDGDD